MTQEYFDIVDKNNQPLGMTKSREEVHRDMVDWHRVTGIWVIDSKNRILCQKRSLKKDTNPSMWQSYIGGHLKAGETSEENAVAEAKEELGLDVKSLDLTPICTRTSERMKHISQIYVLRIDKAEKDFSFNDGEVEEVKWFSLEELEKETAKGGFCNSIYPEIADFIQQRLSVE